MKSYLLNFFNWIIFFNNEEKELDGLRAHRRLILKNFFFQFNNLLSSSIKLLSFFFIIYLLIFFFCFGLPIKYLINLQLNYLFIFFFSWLNFFFLFFIKRIFKIFFIFEKIYIYIYIFFFFYFCPFIIIHEFYNYFLKMNIFIKNNYILLLFIKFFNIFLFLLLFFFYSKYYIYLFIYLLFFIILFCIKYIYLYFIIFLIYVWAYFNNLKFFYIDFLQIEDDDTSKEDELNNDFFFKIKFILNFLKFKKIKKFFKNRYKLINLFIYKISLFFKKLKEELFLWFLLTFTRKYFYHIKMFVLVTPSESYVTYDDPFNVQYDLNEEEYYDERTYQGLKRYFFFNISYKFADFMQLVADYTVFFAKLWEHYSYLAFQAPREQTTFAFELSILYAFYYYYYAFIAYRRTIRAYIKIKYVYYYKYMINYVLSNLLFFKSNIIKFIILKEFIFLKNKYKYFNNIQKIFTYIYIYFFKILFIFNKFNKFNLFIYIFFLKFYYFFLCFYKIIYIFYLYFFIFCMKLYFYLKIYIYIFYWIVYILRTYVDFDLSFYLEKNNKSIKNVSDWWFIIKYIFYNIPKIFLKTFYYFIAFLKTLFIFFYFFFIHLFLYYLIYFFTYLNYNYFYNIYIIYIKEWRFPKYIIVAKRFKIIKKYFKTFKNFNLYFFLNKKIQMIEDICGYEMYEKFFTIPEQASANINRQLRRLNKIQKKEEYLSYKKMKKTHSFFLNIIKKK